MQQHQSNGTALLTTLLSPHANKENTFNYHLLLSSLLLSSLEKAFVKPINLFPSRQFTIKSTAEDTREERRERREDPPEERERNKRSHRVV